MKIPCRLLSQRHKSRLLLARCMHNEKWTASTVRSTFIEFFKKHKHEHYKSCSVLPKRADDELYFTNAGMNQFRPIFLNTVMDGDPLASLQRVCNSQKCIWASGKHNDLHDVGRDGLHHTFFEMLGSWSFGDYFKWDACRMAFKLLTEVYGLPLDRLYFTYFGGDASQGLQPDNECKNVWLNLGVPASRVIPCGAKDNFWDMGESGPCGPCTEIHYDLLGRPDAAHLVNGPSGTLLELWNLVFIQYNRLSDGTLLPLERQHVDTGMGLERLTGVLQSRMSNYDTELFTPVFSAIEQVCGCRPYSGRTGRADADGVDTAYRIVADHLRMVAMATADGLRPGRNRAAGTLRAVIRRALQQQRDVLQGPLDTLPGLVRAAAAPLQDAWTELADLAQAEEVLHSEELLYRYQLNESYAAVSKNFNINKSFHFSADILWDVMGVESRDSLPADVILTAVRTHGFTADEQGLQARIDAQSEKVQAESAPCECLSDVDVFMLRRKGVPTTDDSHKYSFTSTEHGVDVPRVSCKVVALKGPEGLTDTVQGPGSYVIVADQTNFYSTMGGQVSDRGTFTTQEGTMKVESAVMCGGYVAHQVNVEQATIRVGDDVILTVDEKHRHSCMLNHTATHALSHCIDRCFGGVKQEGSYVGPDKLSFQFSCDKTVLTDDDIDALEHSINNLVSLKLPVTTETMLYADALGINNVRKMDGEIYPSNVRVVKFGDDDSGQSVELCGGTHVTNTSQIGRVVVTSCVGLTGGKKTVTAVTGGRAAAAVTMATEARLELDELEALCGDDSRVHDVSSRKRALLKRLKSAVLPRRFAVEFFQRATVMDQWIGPATERRRIVDNMKEFESLLSASDEPVCIAEIPTAHVHAQLTALSGCDVTKPSFFHGSHKGRFDVLFAVPKNYPEEVFRQWREHCLSEACLKFETKVPKVRLEGAPRSQVRTFSVHMKAEDMARLLAAVKRITPEQRRDQTMQSNL